MACRGGQWKRLKIGAGLLILGSLILSACESVKPYQKEYLLNPLMDDESLGLLNSSFAQSTCTAFEKLSAVGSQSSGSGSCPTCGG